MSNYTPATIYELLERNIVAANKATLSNFGDESGATFLDLCGIFAKHYYLEVRKINPARFETELAVSGDTTISDLQKIQNVFYSTGEGTIDGSRPLGMTGRGGQSQGWWWDAANSQIKFTGELTGTFWVVYLEKYAKPTASDDDLLCPENNDEFILAYFERLIELWNFHGSGVQRINLDDALLANAMARMLEDEDPVSHGGLPTNSIFF